MGFKGRRFLAGIKSKIGKGREIPPFIKQLECHRLH